MLFQPLPWGCWVGSTGGTHGAEMEPSARSYPLLKPTGPPHASPRKTSNKTTLRTPLFPYLTQAHVDISYSRQLAWRPTIKLDWHSGCGVGNSEFGAAPETLKWFNQEERVRFSTRCLVWIKPRTEYWRLERFPISLVLELGSCIGNCGSVSWPGLGSTACWLGTKVGQYICVHMCLCVAKSGLPHRPWLSELRVLACLLRCVV